MRLSMAGKKSTFLEVPDTDSLDQLGLLIRDSPKLFDEPECDVTTTKPEPGFCVKTRSLATGSKIFINICKSTELPAPKDITEEELTAILQSENPSDFRVPMSLGEAHAETDKSGNPCTAFDVTINVQFYCKVLENCLFRTFLVTISMEGLEDKYNIEMDKNDWIVLKNKPYHGTMLEITVRKRAKPLVTELETDFERPNVCVPKLSIRKQTRLLLEAEIQLPGVDNCDIIMDIGEDRIKLEALSADRRNKYVLDVFIPIRIVPCDTSARFLAKQKILFVTMPYATSEE